ncbi:PDCD5-related protein [Spinellus fusiger]|nr:PDCD5-related protein [Spinellus fusiger]
MADDELQAIRARRLAELQSKGSNDKARAESVDWKLMSMNSQMEEMRRTMLFQILDNSARERLARIHMVKADKARAVEDLLIRMAQSNQLRNKVTEQQLIDLLGQINQQEPSASKARIYNRRRFDDDSDDEYDL